MTEFANCYSIFPSGVIVIFSPDNIGILHKVGMIDARFPSPVAAN
jgi:hypothetical protein